MTYKTEKSAYVEAAYDKFSNFSLIYGCLLCLEPSKLDSLLITARPVVDVIKLFLE